jgi:hypothetical protein
MLGKLFEEGKEGLYYRVRSSKFPQDTKGSKKYLNRAGDKLQEVVEAVGLFGVSSSGRTETRFLDVCGGPGAFSQFLLANAPSPCSGYSLLCMRLTSRFGITLLDPKKGVGWYDELLYNPAFCVLKGKTQDGNVCLPENIQHVDQELKATIINLVVADGGFELNGDSLYYQELISG